MHDLFGPIAPLAPSKETMAEGAVLLGGATLSFEKEVLAIEKEVLAALNEIIAISPFRHMVIPDGYTMSLAMSLAD
jgi:DNA oxidative demethylase